jgi:predicted dehydrogenase
MNVLIVGLGSIAKRHIEALQALKNYNFCVYGLRSSLQSNIVDGVIDIYNLDEVKIRFDFAIISNPTHLHFESIRYLSQKKIPLFIEKPALHTLNKAEELVELLEKKDLINYVACNLRFHPCIVFLKEKILNLNRNINELNVYCGSYLPNWRPGVDFRKIYSANAKMGGGVHLDLFHEFDYTIWLFGIPNKSKSILRSVSSLGIDSVDYANYILEYDTFSANIILNYYRKKPKRIVEIVFDTETLTIDLINNLIKNEDEEVIFRAENFTLKDTYQSQLNYFISFLNTDKKPFNSLKESLQILKIVLDNS